MYRIFHDSYWPGRFLDIETVCEGEFPKPGSSYINSWQRRRWTTRCAGPFSRIVEIDHRSTAMRATSRIGAT